MNTQGPGLLLTASIFVILSIVITLFAIHYEYEHDTVDNHAVHQPSPTFSFHQFKINCLDRDGNIVLVHFITKLEDGISLPEFETNCSITLTPEDQLVETIQQQIKIAKEKEQ